MFLHCEGAGLRDVHGALRLVREALGDCLGAVGPTIRMFCVAFARGVRGVPRRNEPGDGGRPRRPPPTAVAVAARTSARSVWQLAGSSMAASTAPAASATSSSTDDATARHLWHVAIATRPGDDIEPLWSLCVDLPETIPRDRALATLACVVRWRRGRLLTPRLRDGSTDDAALPHSLALSRSNQLRALLDALTGRSRGDRLAVSL